MERFEAGTFDVIVVGAGHAGSEAALASARMGQKTLLLTINLDMVAFMPCNPSVGGPAKGVVVREIDALGGEMGRNIDKTYIQMRMLNTGKGPAVRALRAQADKFLYANEMKHTIEREDNIILRQGIAEDLIIEDGVCLGIVTNTGAVYRSKSVILTAGTSSRGQIIIGELKYSSGPNNSQPSIKLSESLLRNGFELARFKTGTPPRVKASTIDYSVTEEQPGDEKANHFSYETPDSAYVKDQLSCWLTYSNEKTHDIIKANLHRAPMFTGIVEGVGARYCPSIEDKIVRFSDKPRHQMFLEPEGRNTEEVYVQGLSTSMPEDVQLDMIRSVAGLEKAEMMRTGYAIEYDVVVPYQLRPSLETKIVENLFTAGQMNGTSGYEEAASQGLMAGINAALKNQGKEPFVMKRSEGYIGVMVDDLVTKGTMEPYRLLTSRAEYRLLLRHDNADFRLTEIGHEIGLVSDERYETFLAKKALVEDEIKRLMKTRLKPTAELQAFLVDVKGASPLKDGILAADFLRRPEMTYEEVVSFAPATIELPLAVKEQVEIQIKYEGYIQKAIEKVEKMKRMESKRIPERIDYEAINGLATEARQKLVKIQPETIAQASRISGVNPADISILMVYVEQGKIAKVAE
ncbi:MULTISPECIES: tRNA uridine-5-carboxymethylaminomethyl(34) synthesis enzyme MnmG [Carnobacterium]|jgi:tRNA uridine 5-carboxymethylaminomethyl modification enzyme|uniref:tRNA uridine-5-carboxymethylaminomethyl(34) synthesis enzyme MnmG n=1 Tax=Carnobacterium TaxID=2747 RepID=UPI00054F9EDB|nr:tRNA uridine-5-carboxymethylaminomethyl(34) synthesis enzyme MnmG [Carnobacterium maltaromaticum]AOA03436.1 tRNA uridine(34) 5-carboxymethylaminomethyl synthesis enzyme MnmG [Carnobacterium maltaromaticum]KRN63979.1 glucose-inhibited division protein A [Carnobacterium maltaromaticum DSM 20342]KRN71421.1 glucose-inhibited division protein A [Carnobacterium maltaromaticum]KRN86418.1 glucose-inhibited division protein A [Carnobacterium maltaromaticum]MBC9788096.1 tRNA uridine-5-carboxymethylam